MKEKFQRIINDTRFLVFGILISIFFMLLIVFLLAYKTFEIMDYCEGRTSFLESQKVTKVKVIDLRFHEY